MKENKELNEHIKSIGEWAAQDSKRVAFVVTGEITADGVETSNSLVGRPDRIARALFGTAMENKDFKQIIELAGKMVENPLMAAILCARSSGDEHLGDKPKSDLADSLIGFLEVLKDKIKND